MKENTTLIELLSWAAITGNILFILWVTYNGFQEHFRGSVYQKLSYIGLMGLLILNIVLILQKRSK